jgi:hypothetical protein
MNEEQFLIQQTTLSVQMAEVIKDIAALDTKIQVHENRHRSNALWGWTLAATIVGSNVGVIISVAHR